MGIWDKLLLNISVSPGAIVTKQTCLILKRREAARGGGGTCL